MKRKIRVGAVSYLNTKPLIYGLEIGILKNEIELIIDYPSKIASMLLNDEIDLGLVPVVIIPELKEKYIISNYCIGCNGKVASVCLFSEVPLSEIKTILLDYQSRTSIDMLKILVNEYWKINPVFEQTFGEYRKKISGKTAALVIGDRALEQRRISTCIYDLGQEWKKYTQLPFVFAAWVSNKKLDSNFIAFFNEANLYGLNRITEIVANHSYVTFDLQEYYTKYISYPLDDFKRKGLEVFLQKNQSNACLTL